jgi:ribosomal protein L16 Arg81 hydroxylase
MSVLADLLYPYSVEDFFIHHWTKRSIALSGKGQHQFEHLFSWEALTHLLNFHQISHPDLRLALNGKVLDESENANLNHWFQQGATVILNQVHKRVPAIAQFAAALKHELGYSTQVNAYCSFPEKQGFSAHYDTHEVFILQVEGTKQWFVFTDTMTYPLVDQKSSSLPAPETPPYLSCILHPGDVLYIPRGHWHYAVALDQPSLHLTLGVHCKTGIDWLEWMLGELRQAESWRESLPICANPEMMQSHLNRLIQDLSDRLAQPDNGDRYIRYLNSLSKPIAPYALPSQAGFELFPQGMQTTFKKPAFQRIQISELPDVEGYKVVTSGKEILLKGVNAILIEKLFSQGNFSGATLMSGLTDYDWELDLVPLLSRLVMEGILFVESESSCRGLKHNRQTASR